MTATSDGWAGLAFASDWRRYQQLALAAFDADRAARRRSTHIVAPPGSGKTIIGLEIARQLGQPTLVLCPTAAIQQQWGSALTLFGGGDPPLHAHTYQAICQTADPGGVLERAALARLAAERARDTAIPVEVARAELDGYEGAARRRLQKDVATVTATLKREIARGEHLDLAAHDLLGPGAAARLAELQASGVRTVLLDECHHLVSTWGYLVRAVIAALGDEVHVVGLTATSPLDLSGDEAALYDDLLGEVDFEIPTPAVVKEGYLAPYQELALFTTPLDSERAWLDEHHARFQELLDRIQDPPVPGSDEEELAFGSWVIARMRYRDLEGESGAKLSFAAFAKRQPRLARAGIRYLRSAGLELPPDAPRGEDASAPLDVDDWLALLDDWALRCLRAHPGAAAERLWEQLAGGLADIGYTLTRRGIRPGRDDLDRVLVHSSAKALLVADALDAEHAVRGPALRAVVLCDSERPARAPEDTALTLGGGLALLRALAADDRTALLRPLLMTGTTVACAPADGDAWRAAIAAHLPPELAAALRTEPLPGGVGDAPLAAITADHPAWTTAAYVPAVTRAFAAAAPTGRALIGTRALLGEGWDCPPVNVLVDCTSVAASVSVRQMRGRSLRLDPADGQKIASNWDVVCVVPELERGSADYARFVRRHSHLHAPCEDGSIESGVSHVHPELSPYAPPPADRFTALNIAAIERAADLAAAQERWRIGEPYRGEELPVLLVRRRAAAESESAEPLPLDYALLTAAQRLPASGRVFGLGGIAALLAAAIVAIAGAASSGGTADGASSGGAAGAVAVTAALLVIALALLATGLLRARARGRTPVEPVALERAARAVLDAYVALGEIRPQAAQSLQFAPRLGGRIRCALADGSPAENRAFANALEEALGGATAHRYLVSRALVAPGASPPLRLARATAGKERALLAWHPVPSDLGRNRGRADAYLSAWQQWVSPEAQLQYTVGSEPGQQLLLQASGDAGGYAASHRTLWV